MDSGIAPRGALDAAAVQDGLPLNRVLIVDDHPLFLSGLAGILENESLALAVKGVGSVTAACEALREHPDTDLILLDITLQEEAGLTLLEKLSALGIPVPVVVISSRDDETSVRAAKAAGAVGFLPKSADRHALRKMIGQIIRGDFYYPTLQASVGQPEGLTPRQMEVLRLLAEGLPNKRICQSLSLTEHTVKTHLKALFSFFDVHNRTECVTQARNLGLV